MVIEEDFLAAFAHFAVKNLRASAFI